MEQMKSHDKSEMVLAIQKAKKLESVVRELKNNVKVSDNLNIKKQKECEQLKL